MSLFFQAGGEKHNIGLALRLLNIYPREREREREGQNIAAKLTLFNQLIPEKTLRILKIPGTLKEESSNCLLSEQRDRQNMYFLILYLNRYNPRNERDRTCIEVWHF